LRNDLAQVVARPHPQIRGLEQEFLRLGADASGMTGSGSAVFGIFSSRAAAQLAAAAFRRRGVWSIAVRTLHHAAAPKFID